MNLSLYSSVCLPDALSFYASDTACGFNKKKFTEHPHLMEYFLFRYSDMTFNKVYIITLNIETLCSLQSFATAYFAIEINIFMV